VARAIEEQCSQKQLAKMEKVTCWTRIFVAIYAYEFETGNDEELTSHLR